MSIVHASFPSKLSAARTTIGVNSWGILIVISKVLQGNVAFTICSPAFNLINKAFYRDAKETNHEVRRE